MKGTLVAIEIIIALCPVVAAHPNSPVPDFIGTSIAPASLLRLIARKSLDLPVKGSKFGKAHEIARIRGYHCDS